MVSDRSSTLLASTKHALGEHFLLQRRFRREVFPLMLMTKTPSWRNPGWCLCFLRTFVFSSAVRYNEVITRKGVVSLKTQYVLELDDFEHRLLIMSLNRLRNRVIDDGIDSIDVDWLLLKVTNPKEKKRRE